jgi:hypothetical protein
MTTRDELLDLRKRLFEEYKYREQLGDFDANASVIRLCLEALVLLTQAVIKDQKKK